MTLVLETPPEKPEHTESSSFAPGLHSLVFESIFFTFLQFLMWNCVLFNDTVTFSKLSMRSYSSSAAPTSPGTVSAQTLVDLHGGESTGLPTRLRPGNKKAQREMATVTEIQSGKCCWELPGEHSGPSPLCWHSASPGVWPPPSPSLPVSLPRPHTVRDYKRGRKTEKHNHGSCV